MLTKDIISFEWRLHEGNYYPLIEMKKDAPALKLLELSSRLEEGVEFFLPNQRYHNILDHNLVADRYIIKEVKDNAITFSTINPVALDNNDRELDLIGDLAELENINLGALPVSEPLSPKANERIQTVILTAEKAISSEREDAKNAVLTLEILMATGLYGKRLEDFSFDQEKPKPGIKNARSIRQLIADAEIYADPKNRDKFDTATRLISRYIIENFKKDGIYEAVFSKRFNDDPRYGYV